MNAVARAETITNSNFLHDISFGFFWSESKVLVLLFLLLISALGIVYIKDLNRRLYISHQQLQGQLLQLQAENNKLLIEYSAWGAEAHIQLVAQQKLQMQVPAAAEVVMIKV